MSDVIEYFVDDKQLSTLKSELTVADIFASAGLSAEQFILISQDGTEHRNQNDIIEIHFGDRFTTEKSEREPTPPAADTIHYKVNGEEQVTQQESLSVEEILRNAGKAASINLEQIDSYILENIETGKKYENLADQVDLKEGDQFLVVHTGATPVACST